MNPLEIALHLIKEDLKYHQLVHQLSEVDLHLEHYPDIASAVAQLLVKDLTDKAQQQWTDQYVLGMSKAREIAWKDDVQIEKEAGRILKTLLVHHSRHDRESH